MKDDVIDALMERMQKDFVEQDTAWGEMPEETKKEDVLSVKDSESLLTRMKNS